MKFLLASEYSDRAGWGSLPDPRLFLALLAGAAFCLGATPFAGTAFCLALAFAAGLGVAFAPLTSAANNRCLWGLSVLQLLKKSFPPSRKAKGSKLIQNWGLQPHSQPQGMPTICHIFFV